MVRSTICLCMIVKNEAKIIRECLKSVVGSIDYWVICDTGSTDGTQDIIKDFFKEVNIEGELHQNEWVNFGYNRTKAFIEARGKCDYTYVIDADDRLNGKIVITDKNYTHVNINVEYGSLFFKRVQIFNNRLEWVYQGALHEHPILRSKNTKLNILDLEGCYVKAGTFGNRSENPNKYADDAELLEKELLSDPNNKRYVYYLAQSYRDSHQWAKAIKNYEKRSKMGGNPEEVYYSMYMVGKLKTHLDKDFETEILYDYLKAYNYRKHRLETLFEIMVHYRFKKDYKHAFAYGVLGLNTPRTNDNMMVTYEIYDWMYLDEFAACAIYCGFVDMAKKIMNNLIESDKTPKEQKERIKKNLEAVNN